MEKALIIRHCAFGDAIHMSHLPRLLDSKGYEVHVNTNWKGSQILAYNPFIKSMYREHLERYPSWIYDKYFDVISEGFDKVINLFGSIEMGLLAMESQNEYYMSSNLRRQRWSGINYYDHMTELAGYPELRGKFKGEMFFGDKEVEIVERWISTPRFKDKFIIMINLSGTGPHKRFLQAKEVAEELLKDKENIIITTGSDTCKDIDFGIDNDRCVSITGRFPFRQAALVTKYVDCVIGCESGLMCASTMWETPTIQLMTATSILAHNKYNRNDYSLQSECYCSPCHKGPYQYRGCPSKDGNPLCVYFDISKIINQVKRIKNARVFANKEN